MKIEAFFRQDTFTLTYVAWDPATKDAVIIDPVLDYDPRGSSTKTTAIDVVSAFVNENGLHVHWLLETHPHADHLSGAQLLKRRFKAPVAIGESITKVQATFRTLFDLPAGFPSDGSQFDKLIKDGEKLVADSLEVLAIATPGHTPACMSYQIDDAIFVGDALFIEDYGTGRVDFPLGSADNLYSSVHDRLYALPDDTRVLVGQTTNQADTSCASRLPSAPQRLTTLSSKLTLHVRTSSSSAPHATRLWPRRACSSRASRSTSMPADCPLPIKMENVTSPFPSISLEPPTTSALQ